jgi:DNA-binding NarL/FixJ family response regulator
MPDRSNPPAHRSSFGRTAPAPKVRVLLVDDHPILVEGLTASINNQPDLMVCGSAPSAREALKAVENLKPSLAVVDISLLDSHGIDLANDLAARHPELPVLVLSSHDETLYAERALRAGAKGYVMKRQPMDKLLEAIRKVAQGGLCFSEAITARVLNRFSSSRSGQPTLPMDRLSDRELEILELTGHGRKTREIAEALHVSMKTVQAHREHIKEKLELSDGLTLTRFAVNWVESNTGNRETDGPKR